MEHKIEILNKYYSEKFKPEDFALEINDKKINLIFNGIETNRILIDCIAENDGFVAWIERSNLYVHRYYMYSKLDNGVFSDKLPGETKDENEFDFVVNKFLGDHYFMVYQGEWYNYHICSIKDRTLKYIRVNGEALRIFEEHLTFQDYGPKAPVYKITIPNLELVSTFSQEEANELGISPNSDIYWNDEYNYHSINYKS